MSNTQARDGAVRDGRRGSLDVVESFNGALLQSSLHAEAASLGIVDFLETRVSPLLVALSGARRTRRIGLRHERFAHERLSSVLHGLRSSLAPRAGAPTAVLASLSDGLAIRLDVIALVLAAAGWGVVTLGAECPLAEVAAAIEEASATAVVIDVPNASREIGGRLRRLRTRMGPLAALVLTGESAQAVSSALVLSGPSRLYQWACRG